MLELSIFFINLIIITIINYYFYKYTNHLKLELQVTIYY